MELDLDRRCKHDRTVEDDPKADSACFSACARRLRRWLVSSNPLHRSITSIGSKVKMTVAYLKEMPSTPSIPSCTSGMRSVAARLLGAGTGTRPLSFVGSNGVGGRSASGSCHAGQSRALVNYDDDRGTYIIFNIADSLFIRDLNYRRPVKRICFSDMKPLCHAFDSEAKDGHDLIVGLFNVIEAAVEGTCRCTGVAWVPGHEGFFVVSNADGNLFVYDKSKDVNTDWTFPTVEDQSEMKISYAKSSKSNPVARWHICQGAINAISFSPDGTYLATIGRDGYLRVFDFAKEQLIFGGKSYFGALLCCSWSTDGKYLLSGGEDDLVQVWSMHDRKMVAWGEGHKSWVSAVAFDSYWSPPKPYERKQNSMHRFASPKSDEAEEDPIYSFASPKSDETKENTNIMYRFASIGQDAQLLLWDLTKDELNVSLTHASSCSESSSSGSCSASSSSGSSSTEDRDKEFPLGFLHPSPRLQEVPKLSPEVAHLVGVEPLFTLEFTSESVITVCRRGRITTRPREEIDNETETDQQHPGSSKLVIGNGTGNYSNPSRGCSLVCSKTI
uniref:Uncharacterized protein n=1 Tax=Oryza rufipogon TaxID=4529 RepID=A0A0E0R4W4_ORYRU